MAGLRGEHKHLDQVLELHHRFDSIVQRGSLASALH